MGPRRTENRPSQLSQIRRRWAIGPAPEDPRFEGGRAKGNGTCLGAPIQGTPALLPNGVIWHGKSLHPPLDPPKWAGWAVWIRFFAVCVCVRVCACLCARAYPRHVVVVAGGRAGWSE